MAEINLGRPSQKGYPAQRELDKTSTDQRAALARLLLQQTALFRRKAPYNLYAVT
jgi:hypothetical protein